MYPCYVPLPPRESPCRLTVSADSPTPSAGGETTGVRQHAARHRLKSGPHRTRQCCSGPVCDCPSASRPVPCRQSRPRPAGDGFDGTERAGTRSDGRKQGRNSADGCGEDRAIHTETAAAPAPARVLLVSRRELVTREV